MLERIRILVEDLLEDDQFLVDLVQKGQGSGSKLMVLVDGDSSLTIDDCANISRKLSSHLEEQEIFDSKYILEVSSPGLDHPLNLVRQYQKNIGRNLRIQTNKGNQVEGKLQLVENDFIEIQQDKRGKKKDVVQNRIRLPLTDIRLAKVLVSFKN